MEVFHIWDKEVNGNPDGRRAAMNAQVNTACIKIRPSVFTDGFSAGCPAIISNSVKESYHFLAYSFQFLLCPSCFGWPPKTCGYALPFFTEDQIHVYMPFHFLRKTKYACFCPSIFHGRPNTCVFAIPFSTEDQIHVYLPFLFLRKTKYAGFCHFLPYLEPKKR